MSPIQEMITSHPLLADIDARFEHLFFDFAQLKKYASGDIIFREGESAEHFYLIHSGAVALETELPGRGKRTVQVVGSEDPLGWSWLFPPYIWHFTAHAEEPTELIALDAANLRIKMMENPTFGRDLALRISRILFERLQATRFQLSEYEAHDRDTHNFLA